MVRFGRVSVTASTTHRPGVRLKTLERYANPQSAGANSLIVSVAQSIQRDEPTPEPEAEAESAG